MLKIKLNFQFQDNKKKRTGEVHYSIWILILNMFVIKICLMKKNSDPKMPEEKIKL